MVLTRLAVKKAAAADKQIQDNKVLAELAHLKYQVLGASLLAAGIDYESKSAMTELQAHWALRKLGIVTNDTEASIELLKKAAGWCGSNATQLKQMGNNKWNKWENVAYLIREEHDKICTVNLDLDVEMDKEDKKSKPKVKSNKRKAARETTSIPRVQKRRGRDASVGAKSTKSGFIPQPAVANLLIAMINGYIEGNKNDVKAIPSSLSVAELKKRLGQLPCWESAEELSKFLEAPRSRFAPLLSEIFNSFGKMLVPATGNLIIPGFSAGVQQYVIARPSPSLETNFIKRLKALDSKSVILFHGTSLQNAFGILLSGFLPSHVGLPSHGVYTAQNPSTSYGDAFKEDVGCYGSGDFCLRSYGALFVCEVAGDRTLGTYQTVIPDPELVMARYLLLLPPNEDYLNIPRRQIVLPALEEAVQVIKGNMVEEE